MKKIALLLMITAVVAACSSSNNPKTSGEKIPEIAGTWYHNGDTSLPCYIVQNQESLVFMAGGTTSSGSLRSSFTVFAKEWNANGVLSSDKSTITWADRKWVRATFHYPSISGVWYEDGEAAKKITITQRFTKLVMDNGIQKLHGYFYTTNAIYSLENNNYGVYNPLKRTLTWGNKVWVRTPVK